MSEPAAHISAVAKRQFIELRDGGIDALDRSGLAQYRQQIISECKPRVEQLLARFDGDVELVEINGVSCRQVTAADWSDEHGICLQYAFGGGYVSGSSYEDLIIALPLAEQCSARIVMVEYRLSPEHPYPEPQQDMWRVYPELLARYGAARLVVGGESAGGNQALGLLLHIRDNALSMPRCAVLMSPWCDLGNRGDSHQFNDDRDPTLNQAWALAAAQLHAAGTALDDPGMSPLYSDLHALAPCIITTGSCDLLLSQCLRLARKLRDANVACDLRVWEGMWHVFEFYPIPEANTSIAEIAGFIKSHC